MAVNAQSNTGHLDFTEYFVGDAFHFTIFAYEQDGTAKDFSSLTVTLEIYDARRTPVTVLTAVVSSNSQTLEFSGTPADMPARAGVYSYKVRWDDGANDVQTMLVGQFIAK